MAKSTGNGQPIVDTTPDIDDPSHSIAPDIDDPGPPELVDELAELEDLRRENAELKLQLKAAGMAAVRSDGAMFLTTDVDPAERRAAQAEHERAVMMRSEGARQDALQQANVKATDRREGGGVRFADTPTSAVVQHDDAPNDPINDWPNDPE